MSIIFPRNLPGPGFETCEFDIVRNDAVNRDGAGHVDSMELYDPFWSMKASTPPLTRAERAVWRGWNLSLRGSNKRFFAHDPEHEYPRAYGKAALDLLRHSGESFDGTCTLVSTTATTLALEDLPDGYQFKIGDNVSIGMTGAQRSLHVVTEDVAGDTDGNATIPVEPPVRTGADVEVAVQLVRASCIMVMVPGTFSAPAANGLTPVSFQAVQVLA